MNDLKKNQSKVSEITSPSVRILDLITLFLIICNVSINVSNEKQDSNLEKSGACSEAASVNRHILPSGGAV